MGSHWVGVGAMSCAWGRPRPPEKCSAGRSLDLPDGLGGSEGLLLPRTSPSSSPGPASRESLPGSSLEGTGGPA